MSNSIGKAKVAMRRNSSAWIALHWKGYEMDSRARELQSRAMEKRRLELHRNSNEMNC